MFHVILFEPEIPPNAGNVIRLCAKPVRPCTWCGRSGFTLDDRA